MKFNLYDEIFYCLYAIFYDIGIRENDKRYNGLVGATLILVLIEFFFFMVIVGEITLIFKMFDMSFLVHLVFIILATIVNLYYFLKNKRRDKIFEYYSNTKKSFRLRAFSILIILIIFLGFWIPNMRSRNIANIKIEQQNVLQKNLHKKNLLNKKYERTASTKFIIIKENKMWKFDEDYDKGRTDSLFLLLKSRELPKEYLEKSRIIRYGRIYEIDGKYDNIKSVPKDKILGYWEFNYTKIDRISFYPNPDYKKEKK